MSVLRSTIWMMVAFMVTSFISDGRAHAAANDPENFAQVSSIDGDGSPMLRRKKGTQSVVGRGDKIFPGDRITTDGKSAVELFLFDGSVIRVGLNSEYQLSSVKDDGGILSWVFRLTKGSVRALIEKSPQKNKVKFRVNSPTGTMGVRGTELVMTFKPETQITTVYIIEGVVDFGRPSCANEKLKERECIAVKTGETASVGKDGGVAAPIQFKGSDLMTLSSATEAAIMAKDGVKTDETLGAGAEGSLGTKQELAEGLSLFIGAKKAGSTESLAAIGDINQMMKNASEQIAIASDALLGRTKELREEMHRAMADGTYNQRLNLVSNFDDLARSKVPDVARVKRAEQMGGLVAKKFALSKSLVTAMAKVTRSQLDELSKSLSQTRVATARRLTAARNSSGASRMMKASQDVFNAGDVADKINKAEHALKMAELLLAAAREVSLGDSLLAENAATRPITYNPLLVPKIPKSNYRPSNPGGEGGNSGAASGPARRPPTPIADVLEDHDFGIRYEEWVTISTMAYYRECKHPYISPSSWSWDPPKIFLGENGVSLIPPRNQQVYCDEEIGEGIWDGERDMAFKAPDGLWYNKKLVVNYDDKTRKSTQIVRKDGKCTKTTSECKITYTPCDMSKGKFCTPTATKTCTDIETKEIKTCPKE